MQPARACRMFDGLKGILGTRRPATRHGSGSAAATAAPPPKGSTRSATRHRRTQLAKRFQLIAETSSQGSMSKVYKALDLEQGRTVCLKLQDLAKTTAALARTSSAEPRPSEGEILQRISHPGVVRC